MSGGAERLVRMALPGRLGGHGRMRHVGRKASSSPASLPDSTDRHLDARDFCSAARINSSGGTPDTP